jgi:hypothetical protein
VAAFLISASTASFMVTGLFIVRPWTILCPTALTSWCTVFDTLLVSSSSRTFIPSAGAQVSARGVWGRVATKPTGENLPTFVVWDGGCELEALAFAALCGHVRLCHVANSFDDAPEHRLQDRTHVEEFELQ